MPRFAATLLTSCRSLLASMLIGGTDPVTANEARVVCAGTAGDC
jgi:hypothetical protein